MLLKLTKRPANRTLRGWAVSVLEETGAISQCAEHGWVVDRGDPHARERALFMARQLPPDGVPVVEAIEAIKETLDGMGDTCPECEG